ncbi:MAG TPA: BamA/TamA family outer membrane protein, partial [Tepidisphaeraceae bacterium]
TYGLGGGVVVFGNGFIQKQSGTFAYALGSSNGTYGGSFGEDDLQLNPVSRLFLDSKFGYILDRDYKAHVNGNRRFVQQAAGTNDSGEKNYFIDQAGDAFASLTFRYLLPIGGGRNTVINHYVLKDGILVSGATGGHGWNPFKTGRTYLQLTPFVEDISLDTPVERRRRDQLHFDENGIRFGVVYDNTDFPLNPSSGNVTKIILSRDFGWFESSESWTNLSGEFSQFFDLGHSKVFRQQVLAFDFWTSYSVSWDETIRHGVRRLKQAPPYYDGATLGGSERLRAFAENRFWDRAAGYGSIELRLIPEWNPLGRIKLLKPADITWMQWVVFAEAGRVSNEYTEDLLKHLKGDVGFGLRLLANDTLVRLDVAASNEGVTVVAQLSQPF